MLRSTLLYGSLIAFSVAVGVLIGGGPGALRSSETIASVPSTTSVPNSTTLPASTVAPAAVASTTEPTTTTTTSTTTTTPVTTTTDTTTTTTPVTTTTESPEPALREGVRIAVANGSRTQGIAGRFADLLSTLGYVEVAAINAVQIEQTTVFHVPGLELEAQRLADDATLADATVAPMDELPEVFTDVEFELVLVLGADRQVPPVTDPPAAGG